MSDDRALRRDRDEMIALVPDPRCDLVAPLPWSRGAADVVREALLAACREPLSP